MRRVLFAHGAGASSSSAWMRGWADALGSLGTVRTFDYRYAREGRRRPDRLPVLVESHCAALDSWAVDEGPVVLAGKSMGGRVGCHVALQRKVAAVVCFGYPLVGSGKTRPVRDAGLLELATPILFIQGTRDRLCGIDHLNEVRDRMGAPSALHVVDGGDHSLLVGKRTLTARGERQEDVDARILQAILRFVAGCMVTPTGSGTPTSARL